MSGGMCSSSPAVVVQPSPDEATDTAALSDDMAGRGSSHTSAARAALADSASVAGYPTVDAGLGSRAGLGHPGCPMSAGTDAVGRNAAGLEDAAMAGCACTRWAKLAATAGGSTAASPDAHSTPDDGLAVVPPPATRMGESPTRTANNLLTSAVFVTTA